MPRQLVATVTPPASLPVTVAELADFAKLDPDAIQEDLCESFLAAATDAAENYTNRSFVTRTLRLSLDGTHGRAPWTPGYYELPVDYFDAALPATLELPRGPVIAVTSITTYDTLNAGTVYPAEDYDVFGDRVALNSGNSWPSGLRANAGAEVVYTAGYGAAADVPRAVRMAILMHAARMEARECGCDEPPAECLALLRPYRVMGL